MVCVVDISFFVVAYPLFDFFPHVFVSDFNLASGRALLEVEVNSVVAWR